MAEDELVLVRTVIARVHIHPLRIDAHDDRLAPIRVCDRLNRTRPVPLPAIRAQSLDGVDRLGADGHLVRARAEVRAGDLERGARRAVRVDAVLDAAADRERDEDGLGGGAHDGEHGLVPEGRVPEGGDVEEADLVGPGGVVPCGERDGLPEVAHRAGGLVLQAGSVAGGHGLLAHVVLVAFCDDKVALVVRPDVHTRDDALREAILRLRRSRIERRGWLVRELVFRLAQPGMQDAEAGRARLLGVELRAEDVSLAHRRHEDVLAVLRCRVYPVRRLWVAGRGVRGTIGVDEVVVRPGVDALRRALLRVHEVDGIPAHVRHGLVAARERLDGTRDDAQAIDTWVLGGGSEEDLQADAYTEVRSPRGDVLSQRLQQAFGLQVLDGAFEGTDTWKYEFLQTRSLNTGIELADGDGDTYRCFGKVIGRRNPLEFKAELGECVRQTPDVPGAIVKEVEAHCAVDEWGDGWRAWLPVDSATRSDSQYNS